MGALPEELWVQILQMGLQNGQLHYRDLCALAIVSKRLNRMCELDCVWKELLTQDFPESALPSTAPVAVAVAADGSLPRLGSEVAKAAFKKQYRTRYEKVKEKKIAAHKRQVLRVTSSLNVLQREVLTLQGILQSEQNKFRSSQKELASLDRTSRTSVALQIWQPQAVTTRHEQVTQQIPVDLAARENILRLEVQVCLTRIQCVQNTLKSYSSAIERKQNELAGLTYNPTEDLKSKKDISGKKHGKRKKSFTTDSQLYSLSTCSRDS